MVQEGNPSGKENKKGKIVKKGNKRLRRGLYFPTMNAIQYNRPMRKFYNRLVARGKEKKLVLTAAKKIITYCHSRG